jgi:Rab GDP dissociation inhibitor
MASGKLTKMLLHTKVTRYLEFKSIDGSYVMQGSKILKVPATTEEALSSSLMGMFEKRRFRNFLVYVNNYDEKDASTWKDKDLTRMTMRQLYTDFGLVPATHEFISHAMCLEVSEEHMDLPALDTVRKLQCYCSSMQMYGKTPYIYPMYGLGGLPEGFSRLCAIHGGTFMLNTEVDEILFDDLGAAWGVKCGNQVAKGTMIIGDPSYFPKEKVKAVGKVVRSICFLNHPIPNTNNAESCQIILPGPTVGRKNDVFVCMLSDQQKVAAQGVYVAIVSTQVETSDPASELNAGLGLLGQIMQRFDSISDCYAPVADGLADRCFISSSFDPSSHFEQDAEDLLNLYKRVTGEELDMTIDASSVEADY